jgi:hypothetical protein
MSNVIYDFYFIAYQFTGISALLADAALHDDNVDRGDDGDVGAVVPAKGETGHWR